MKWTIVFSHEARINICKEALNHYHHYYHYRHLYKNGMNTSTERYVLQ